MVHDIDSHDFARRHESRGQADVIPARRRVAGRVIVKEHDSGRTCDGSGSEHLTWMHQARVERADRDESSLQQPQFRIEQHDTELLDRPGSELRQQVCSNITCVHKLRPLGRGAGQGPSAKLDSGENLCRLGAPDTLDPAKIVPRGARQAVHTAHRLKHSIGQLESGGLVKTVPDDNRHELVVTDVAGPEPVEVFARTIRQERALSSYYSVVGCRPRPPIGHNVPVGRHATYTASVIMRWCRSLCSLFVALVVACSSPPAKEIDAAERAIDTARAAGAERYAPETYEGAVQALARSREAVTQIDYRLALNYALEAHERAQRAIETTVAERMARKRAAETALAAVESAVEDLTASLTAASAAHVRAARLRAPREAAQTAEEALQEARAALDRKDYDGAQNALAGFADSLGSVTAELDAVAASGSRRRGR